MSQSVTAATLAFVLIGAMVGLFWLELRDGKRNNNKKREKPESTVI